MMKETKDEIKQTINLSVIVFLLIFFIFVEIRLTENVVSLIPVLIVSSIILIIGIITTYEEYQSYAGLTFIIFGLVMVLNDAIKLIKNFRIETLILGEIFVGIILILYGKYIKKKNILL